MALVIRRTWGMFKLDIMRKRGRSLIITRQVMTAKYFMFRFHMPAVFTAWYLWPKRQPLHSFRALFHSVINHRSHFVSFCNTTSLNFHISRMIRWACSNSPGSCPSLHVIRHPTNRLYCLFSWWPWSGLLLWNSDRLRSVLGNRTELRQRYRSFEIRFVSVGEVGASSSGLYCLRSRSVGSNP